MGFDNKKIEKLHKKPNKHETNKIFFPSHCKNHDSYNKVFIQYDR